MVLERDERDLSAYRRTSTQPTVTRRMQTRGGIAEPGRGHYIQRALLHMQEINNALGLEASQPVEFSASPHLQQTSSGAVAVHLQQLSKGIPVFQGAQVVRFSPDDKLMGTAGSSVPIADDVPVSIAVPVEEATLIAAQYVAVPPSGEWGATDQFGEPLHSVPVNISGFQPKVIVTFQELAAYPTVLEAGPFGDEIKASLNWLPLTTGLRLMWQVVLTMPDLDGQYRIMVDANDRQVSYCAQLGSAVAAQGNVFHVDGASLRQVTPFPRPWTDYGLPFTIASPDSPPSPTDVLAVPPDWVATDSTVGNCVTAHLEDGGAALKGTVRVRQGTTSPSALPTSLSSLGNGSSNRRGCSLTDP